MQNKLVKKKEKEEMGEGKRGVICQVIT